MAEGTGLTGAAVSGGDDINASDHNELFVDIKKIRQETLTAGEAIVGATLPVAVYQKASDNEIYACDGNDITTIDCIGFAITDGTNGNSFIVQHTGIVGGFTGLIEGKPYYIQDDKTLGTNKGTYAIMVGFAVSETQIKIDIRFPLRKTAVSTTLQHSSDTEKTTNSATYVKLKEILINNDYDAIRIKFDIQSSNNNNNTYGRIYKNGVAIGTEQASGLGGYVTKSEDFNNDFKVGDLLQLYGRRESASDDCDVKNFRIYYDNDIQELIATDTNQDP